MNTIIDLITRLRKKKIRLMSEQGKLRYKSPAGALTAELLDEIKQRKPQILEFLKNAEQSTERPALECVDRTAGLPLSMAQERIWFLYQLEGKGPAYNIPKALRLHGRLDPKIMEKSIHAIINRHEILRTIYLSEKGKTVQHVMESAPFAILYKDFSALPDHQKEEEARRFAKIEFQQPFDLTKSPVLRVCLVKLFEEDHILLITMHHIASDGRSIEVFSHELALFYEAFIAGKKAFLDELPIQ